MASGATAKYAIPYPQPGDATNIPADVEALANALDAIIATAASGVASARPAFGKAGRSFYATDTGLLSLDTGSAWLPLGLVNSSGALISKTVPASSASAGSTGLAADAGHAHSMDTLPVIPGNLIGRAVYAPTTAVTVAAAGTTSFAALDGTNLSVTFTAPLSGLVTVRVSAVFSIANVVLLAMVTHATATKMTTASVIETVNSAPTGVVLTAAGLTPGTSYHWDLATLGTSTASLRAADPSTNPSDASAGGPAVIEVFSA